VSGREPLIKQFLIPTFFDHELCGMWWADSVDILRGDVDEDAGATKVTCLSFAYMQGMSLSIGTTVLCGLYGPGILSLHSWLVVRRCPLAG
jgi:hypothetical protein